MRIYKYMGGGDIWGSKYNKNINININIKIWEDINILYEYDKILI